VKAEAAPPAAHAEVLAIRDEARAELRALAEAFVAEHGPTKGLIGDAFRALKDKAAAVLRKSFLAAALALSGPGPAVEKAVDAAVAKQLDYLDKFAAAVDSGDQPIDGTLVARLESYGSSVWGGAQSTAAAAAAADGATEAMRVLGLSPAHCDECEALAGEWVPIDELTPIGDTPCGGNCLCHVVYKYAAAAAAWTPSPAAAAAGDRVVLADLAKLDASLAADPGFHVGPGGSGAGKPGAYANVEAALDKATTSGEPIDMPRVGADTSGAYVTDGRHRLAVLRDRGAVAVPVTVPAPEAADFRRRFGAAPAR
jgi:hypothetical protein